MEIPWTDEMRKEIWLLFAREREQIVRGNDGDRI